MYRHMSICQATDLPSSGVSLRGESAAEPRWSELQERLRAFVARRVPDPVAVDDLAQEIMLRTAWAGTSSVSA